MLLWVSRQIQIPLLSSRLQKRDLPVLRQRGWQAVGFSIEAKEAIAV
jgi:hypothetical protein